MRKLSLLAAAGVGYVLGAKAGRERYEQIRRSFNRAKDDPRVREKAQQAADLASEKAPVVKDKVAAAAGAATDKVRSATSGSGGSASESAASAGDLNPDRLRVGEDTGPRGDLP